MSNYSIEPSRLPIENPRKEQRIVVIGTSGAGKTTFARSLAQALNCTHIELDALHWLPNWVERAEDEFCALTTAAVAQERWVTDGNYAVVRKLIWSRATTIIWLNYGFPTVFWRTLKRTALRLATREELFSGNRESLRMALFNRDSILWWVISTFHRRRRHYRHVFENQTFTHVEYLEFRRPADVKQFIDHIRLLTGFWPTKKTCHE